jgi:segregation and condensation protein B
MIDDQKIREIIEAALFAADVPLTVNALVKLFADGELDADEGRKQIRDALKALQAENENRGVELKQVASGYRFQSKQELSEWVSRLWDERPPRYTRALLETLALIAYKQPVTRGDIEQVRGVSVSQNIMRTLIERDWIRVVGQREVPGHPALYGTTKAFLDYFNLKTLDELPPLEEIRELIEPIVEEIVDEFPTDVNQPSSDEQAAEASVAVETSKEDETVDSAASADEGVSVLVQVEETPTAEVVQLHAGQHSNNPTS